MARSEERSWVLVDSDRFAVAPPAAHTYDPTLRSYTVARARFDDSANEVPSLPINLQDIFRSLSYPPEPSNILANSRPFLLRFQLDDNYNYKPVFTDCANYAPSVEEEVLIGTYVFRVHAEDPDPPENGGTVTYKFVSAPHEKLKFEINNITGEITTIAFINRDEPSREMEFYLTVLATDNGSPKLYDICTFKVTITDINDNKPVFDKSEYTGSVPQNLPVNYEVMRISATDIDDGENATVHYFLGPENIGDGEYFEIDSSSGVIFLRRAIDQNPGYKFRMVAMVMDLGTFSMFNYIHFDIRVVEPHKDIRVVEPPVFLSRLKSFKNFNDYDAIIPLIINSDKNKNPLHFTEKVYTHNRIQENANINTYITHVEVIDSDKSSPVMYSIIAGNTDDSFSIERATGKIRVNKRLDYEQITEYNLIVRAFDGLFSDIAQVEIFVENVNDNPPIFEDFDKNPTILEEKLVPGCITTVVAYDPDIEDRNADQHIAYFIVEKAHQPFFEIDKTGCMKLKKPLDYDPPNGFTIWTVIVMARDEDGSSTSLGESVIVNITH
ncbi:DE-cadherin-like [Odontomachus brunneus]|uniref:DE-cadherin-like n=1 Tax=Odontomachus brunneus TaxID=486640 RepID=UPI0013F28BCB|nr:DE-cadherin-like [Odontomachus brunneus]